MSDILSIIHENKLTGSQITSGLGTRGEALAADFLVENGYRIVVTNFKVPVGRNSRGAQVTGEIDIVALDGKTLCFIEVKTRRSDEFAPVISNVDLRKQRQITRTARVYRRLFEVGQLQYRFDVVTVLLPKHVAKPSIELTKGFWNDSRFRKRVWIDRTWDDIPRQASRRRG
ncbi:MAG: YraN family protein [Pyrinomonadaceae bacterium]